MTADIVAVDCDLRRLHAWGSTRGEVAYNASLDALVALLSATPPGQLLFEIASPVFYGKTRAEHYHKARWALHNTACAGVLSNRFPSMLVASSSAWTESHPEKERHAMAGATARNHDLRECQAMIAFYQRNPIKWVPFHQFLKEL